MIPTMWEPGHFLASDLSYQALSEPHSPDVVRLSRRAGLSRFIMGCAIALVLSACSISSSSLKDMSPSPTLVASSDPSQRTLTQKEIATADGGSPAPTPSLTFTVEPTATVHTPLVIGQSLGGHPLDVFTFGDGPNHRMIVAGIHGGYEGNTIRLADQLIQVIPTLPDMLPEDTTLYILRSLNPDGEARSDSYKGRANDRYVDLNRNFPSHWASEWPKQGCWTYTFVTGGSHPASEPETRALMNFLITYEIQAMISYHSAALGIFPGGQPPDDGSIRLAEAIAQVSDYPYPPIETGCQYTGQLIDWASDQGIAAVDIELTNHQDTDLHQNIAVLRALMSWQP